MIKSAYPNPFNPSTQIEYIIPDEDIVGVSIYDVNGRIIKNLIDESQSAGVHSIKWDSTNDQGKFVSAGIYFFSVDFKDRSETQKVILLK